MTPKGAASGRTLARGRQQQRDPGRPVGSLTGPRIERLLNPKRRAYSEPEPSRAAIAWLTVASTSIAEIVSRDGWPTVYSLPSTVLEQFSDVAGEMYKRGGSREHIDRAIAATAYYLGYCRPDGMKFTGRSLEAIVDTLPNDLQAHVRDMTPPGQRLAWRHPAGYGRGLLIDRLHYTHLGGIVLGQWMRPQLAAD